MEMFLYARIDRFADTGWGYHIMTGIEHEYQLEHPSTYYTQVFLTVMNLPLPTEAWVASEGVEQMEKDIDEEYNRHKRVMDSLLDAKAKFLSLPAPNQD